MLGQRDRDAQRQVRVLVGAVGVAQVLAGVAVADHGVPVARERGVERVLRAARQVGDAAPLGEHRDEHAVVAVDGAERVPARERAAELVERQPEPRALRRTELGFALAGPANGQHADRRAAEQHLAGGEIVGRDLALRRRRRRAASRATAPRAPAAASRVRRAGTSRCRSRPRSARRRRSRCSTATRRRRSATGSRTARPGSGSARTRATPARRPAAARCAPRWVAVAMPWAKCRSRMARGVSRVRIAVLRTSSSEPSVGLYASRRRLASSTSTERSSSALSCSTRA